MHEHAKDFDLPNTLMLATIELLKQDKRGLLQIHAHTAIPYYWLKKFSAGEFINPSVNRVQFLYESLTNKPLNPALGAFKC